LSASPSGEDHDSLRSILEPTKVLITVACSRRDALLSMANQRFGLILCEAQLNWKDILSYLAEVLEPPRLVITSRMNERLWAEALNLGAWDLLVKPFEAAEVRRVVASALGRRREMIGVAAAG
jgi:DNA-binding response OmpR family regulator